LLISLRSPSLRQVLPLRPPPPITDKTSAFLLQGGCQQANLLALRLSPQDRSYCQPGEMQNVFSATKLPKKSLPGLPETSAKNLK
jgi:hypothetical protein